MNNQADYACAGARIVVVVLGLAFWLAVAIGLVFPLRYP